VFCFQLSEMRHIYDFMIEKDQPLEKDHPLGFCVVDLITIRSSQLAAVSASIAASRSSSKSGLSLLASILSISLSAAASASASI